MRPHKHNVRLVKPAGLCTVACAVLFLAAMLIQYGPTLKSDHGFSLPGGVALILVTGIWFMHGEFDAGQNNFGDDEEGTGDYNRDCIR
ncbi:MAG: hypothetical protein ABSG28_07990 [Methanoregula sp.]|uniref:hypothetical protein n=1 Tax=Methanoregula sp. TaxID=2052170 RepID=UPI003C1B3B85